MKELRVRSVFCGNYNTKGHKPAKKRRIMPLLGGGESGGRTRTRRRT